MKLTKEIKKEIIKEVLHELKLKGYVLNTDIENVQVRKNKTFLVIEVKEPKQILSIQEVNFNDLDICLDTITNDIIKVYAGSNLLKNYRVYTSVTLRKAYQRVMDKEVYNNDKLFDIEYTKALFECPDLNDYSVFVDYVCCEFNLFDLSSSQLQVLANVFFRLQNECIPTCKMIDYLAFEDYYYKVFNKQFDYDYKTKKEKILFSKQELIERKFK